MLVLRYLFKMQATDLYGEKYVERSTMVQDITSLFTQPNDSEGKIGLWQEKVKRSIDYLYDSGILLQSIYDIEIISDSNVERHSTQASKFYISPRGKFLYSLFSQNALLLELYRDSIYVDLEHNDTLSCDMNEIEIMNYLLSYIIRLFDYEKGLIGEAFSNLQKYQDLFGSELLISPLLEGVTKNIETYFQRPQDGFADLKGRIGTFTKAIEQYIQAVSTSGGVTFSISKA